MESDDELNLSSLTKIIVVKDDDSDIEEVIFVKKVDNNFINKQRLL